MKRALRIIPIVIALTLLAGVVFTQAPPAGPTMLHPNLTVNPVISNLTTPISMAFLGGNDFLLCWKRIPGR
jgi:hypothetical protein